MQATVTVLHTHVLVVILFLILFASKAVLLFMGKHKRLDKVRRYTKALDMVFGALILVSGAYLIYLRDGLPGWLIIKIALVLIAIPLGIVGIKRHSKLLAAFSLAVFLYVYGIAETKSLTMQQSGAAAHTTTSDIHSSAPATDATEMGAVSLDTAVESPEAIVADLEEAQLANAKAIYRQVCETCHGPSGSKGLAGAADLSRSNLSLQDRINVVENGRGLMPAFGAQLTEQEAEALAAYTLTLKQQ